VVAMALPYTRAVRGKTVRLSVISPLVASHSPTPMPLEELLLPDTPTVSPLVLLLKPYTPCRQGIGLADYAVGAAAGGVA